MARLYMEAPHPLFLLWDVIPCSLVNTYQLFVGACWLHLQDISLSTALYHATSQETLLLILTA